MTQSDCRKSRMARSPFTITGQKTVAPVDRASLSLCGPTDAPWPQSLQSDEPAQHHQICSQPSTRAGQEGGVRGGYQGSELSSETVHNAAEVQIQSCWPPRYVHAERKSAQFATAVRDFCPPQMSAAAAAAAVMLPVTHNGYRPAVRRQAETEEEGV